MDSDEFQICFYDFIYAEYNTDVSKIIQVWISRRSTLNVFMNLKMREGMIDDVKIIADFIINYIFFIFELNKWWSLIYDSNSCVYYNRSKYF